MRAYGSGKVHLFVPTFEQEGTLHRIKCGKMRETHFAIAIIAL